MEIKNYSSLITEGVEICKKAQEFSEIDFFPLLTRDMIFDIVTRYQSWLDTIIKFLEIKLSNNDTRITFFQEADGIPSNIYILSNYKYMFGGSDESIKLMKDMVIETRKKINYLREIEQEESSNVNDLFTFTLTKDGLLSRKKPIPGDKSYSMDKGSRRHKIIEALVSNKNDNFVSTGDLAEIVSCEEVETRKTCGEIRKQIMQHFAGIKVKEIIDSKTGSGYRINPKAKIIIIP